jgi:phthiocerol/phenolphthiocerol synthesis type-I polyketide synthase E
MRVADSFHATSIAIIGMAGRFPGARNIDEYWRNLREGVESVIFLTDQQVEALGVDPELKSDPNYVKAAACFDGYDLFDASFFGFSPREAEIMDPQHRVFLECAWEALEMAGYSAANCKRPVAVYGGATINTYLLYNLLPNSELVRSLEPVQINIGNGGDFLTTRVSYKLNLKGPSHLIQSACSTSLTAVHLACQSLLNEECDMALAGGVSINVSQRAGYRYSAGGMASPDGHCRAFDAQAQGTIFGSGVGIVVLKRLADALSDRDTIHAVIRGSAINNDGSLKVGYTAPSIDGQSAVIVEALAMAGVEADTISYIETHGTGTPLGDPVEVAALTKAFRASTDKNGFCAIGSVKTNIGHLDAAAGIAGLIKTALALKHRQLPSSLHFEQPNPQIDFAGSPFYVNSQLQEWRSDGSKLRAGVSSFGVGGTNVHVILQEAPLSEPAGYSRPWQLLTLSARTETALITMIANLAAHLTSNDDINLPDVAYTLQVGRAVFPQRCLVVARDVSDAIDALKDYERLAKGVVEDKGRLHPLAFMFTGQGAQYINMGRLLYEHEPLFRQAVDSCASILRERVGLEILAVLYPESGEEHDASQRLQETALAQPALFVIEYALAQLWLSWGIQPQALAGYSIGEYVAACLAGVFTLEDALFLVTSRGRLMQELPTGGMLAVSLSECELQPLLGNEIAIAAINGPNRCTVAGPHNAIDRLTGKLRDNSTPFRRLYTSHAFHSPMMEPARNQFKKVVAGVKLQPPQLPYLSNLTGRWITAREATDPNYWADHICATVRFADNLAELLAKEQAVLLELGPGQTLMRMAQQHPACNSKHVIASTLRRPGQSEDDVAVMLTTLGQLWLAGIEPDWGKFYQPERRRRAPLPAYPFERQRYWLDPVRRDQNRQQSCSDIGRQVEIEPIPERPDLESQRMPENDEVKRHPRPQLPTAYVSPHTDCERTVAEIWQRVLGIEKIGALDNFFDLGGDSLLAIQTATELKKAFQTEIPVVSMYEGLTVRSLAALLESFQKDSHPLLVEEAGESKLGKEAISRRQVLQQKQRARRGERTQRFR